MENLDWQNLTKRERREFKKEEKQQRQRQEAKRARLTKWGIILGLIVISAVGLFIFKDFKAKRYEGAPKIQIRQAIYDFGKIKVEDGEVETSFEVRNEGVSSLVVTGIETSCDCTTAKFKVGDEESPIFGMHDNPDDWSASVEPGKTAALMVIFDPNFHQVSGPITRTVRIFSNDPSKTKEVTVYADVQR